MKRHVPLLVGIVALLALGAASRAVGGPPPSPPHELHFTRCNTTIGDTTPYANWGVSVTMVLVPGGGANLWISAPDSLAGHYRIQGYRTAESTSNTVPPAFPAWGQIGEKTGQDFKIECKGYFGDAAPYLWVDSVDVHAT